MRNGLMGLAGVLLFASTTSVVGCGGEDPADSSETAGQLSGSGGSAGSTGTGGGAGGAATVSASGCTKTEGGTVVTSFCSAAALNTLTDAETLQLCNDTSAYVVSSLSRATACHYQAIISAASNSSPTIGELQSACSATEGACNQDASVPGPGANTLCGRVPPTCTATVEQYSTCVMDEAALFNQGANALITCPMLTFENLSSAYDVPMAASAAPSCTAIKTACPNFSLPYIN